MSVVARFALSAALVGGAGLFIGDQPPCQFPNSVFCAYEANNLTAGVAEVRRTITHSQGDKDAAAKADGLTFGQQMAELKAKYGSTIQNGDYVRLMKDNRAFTVSGSHSVIARMIADACWDVRENEGREKAGEWVSPVEKLNAVQVCTGNLTDRGVAKWAFLDAGTEDRVEGRITEIRNEAGRHLSAMPAVSYRAMTAVLK